MLYFLVFFPLYVTRHKSETGKVQISAKIMLFNLILNSLNINNKDNIKTQVSRKSENILRTRIFSEQWKRAKIAPVYKKVYKKLVKNNRSVSFLPVCAKVFEHIVFHDLFKFSKENNLLSPHQSGFITGDLSVQIYMKRLIAALLLK